MDKESKKLKTKCKICNKIFSTYKKTAKYCSLKCKYKAQSELFSGDGSPSYKGETRTKTSVSIIAKKYFGNYCAICGWDEAGCDAHHNIPVEEGGKNSLTNIIIVCPNHHRLIHDNKISKEELNRIAMILYSKHKYYNI